MLRIAFLDPVPWDYVVDTPRVRPLGGSQSALCYLAEELAKRGHAVALYNQTQTAGLSRGVQCFNLTRTPLAEFSQYDAVVILNTATIQPTRQIRSAVGARTRILLWTQHTPDQPGMQDLSDPALHDVWDGFVMVSRWQAQGYCDVFGIKPERIQIIGNAIAPVFENLFETPEAIAAQKPWPPVLCYTSTPFRGLDVLVEAFPRIRKAYPGATLKVYSSMGVYGVPGSRDPHESLYARCRNTEGVDYIGSVSQTVLAGELKHATCLAYPSTFQETSCIAVMEAMAAGCLVITSDLGALRETTAGFAHLLAPPSDNALHAERFADFSVGVLEQVRSSPAEHAQRLKDQVRFVHQTETWAVRAGEWDAWLSDRVVRC